MKALEYSHFSPIVSLCGFLRRSWAANSALHNPIRLDFELSPDFMVVLVSCQKEEDSNKTEGARVITTLYIDFSDAQGQLTP